MRQVDMSFVRDRLSITQRHDTIPVLAMSDDHKLRDQGPDGLQQLVEPMLASHRADEDESVLVDLLGAKLWMIEPDSIGYHEALALVKAKLHSLRLRAPSVRYDQVGTSQH